MRIVYATERVPICHFTENIFLAGSIEMGVAEEWQERAIKYLSENCLYDLNIYNPRRKDWDNSWGEDSEMLKEQINWELDYIRDCNKVLFYFDPNTKSPITLLELGLSLSAGKDLFVVCPKGFYRRTNVLITCARHNIKIYEKLEEALDAICKG